MFEICSNSHFNTHVGVICEHRGVVAIQSIEESRFRSKPGQRIAQFLAPGFDCGIHEIYSALCYGGTLVLRKDDMDPYAHLDSVDTALILPSVLAELDPADYPNIKLVSCPIFTPDEKGTKWYS